MFLTNEAHRLNAEIEIITKKLKFNSIVIHFLDNQKSWIFLPKKITVFGYKNKKWLPINEKIFVDLEESYDVKLNQIEIVDKNSSKCV